MQDDLGNGVAEETEDIAEDDSTDTDEIAARPKRIKHIAHLPKKPSQRRPVNQRWYMEPVIPALTIVPTISDTVIDGSSMRVESVASDEFPLPPTLGEVDVITQDYLNAIQADEAGACCLQGILFYDDELTWCRITGWGSECGIPVIFYSPFSVEGFVTEEQFAPLSDVLSWLKQSPADPVISKLEFSRLMMRPKVVGKSLCYKQVSYHPRYAMMSTIGTSTVREVAPELGSCRGSMTQKTIRRILKAQETIFKYGTMIPRNDSEANRSPEAVRWVSGRQLEWLRLKDASTFETKWTWAMVQQRYPDYQKKDIGHLFFVYDYKFSGEHRVRLVFDGSRQSEATYNQTYAPTVRSESVRLFHIYAVEYSWTIEQYDVPQAFLRSDADCDIFCAPPQGFSEFPGQLLKLSKMLYGSKQAAALWYNLLNAFLIEICFQSSEMDPWGGSTY